MTIATKYVFEGDEERAISIAGLGRHHMKILKNLMSFQELKQLSRMVSYRDGTVIKCSSLFGLDKIDIFVPPAGIIEVKEPEIIEEFYCWCTNWFAAGRVLEVFGDYGDMGTYDAEEGQIYPDHCNSSDVAIKNYNGIRYKVRICQKRTTRNYVCLSSDFAEYEVDEKVIVFMRGVWKKTDLIEPKRMAGRECRNSEITTCKACRGTIRSDIDGDKVLNGVDGSYLILPLSILGVN